MKAGWQQDQPSIPQNPSIVDAITLWIPSPAPPLESRCCCHEPNNEVCMSQVISITHSILKISGKGSDNPKWYRYTLTASRWHQETVCLLLGFCSRQGALVLNKADLTGTSPNMKRPRCWASREKPNVHHAVTGAIEIDNQASQPCRTSENFPEGCCPNWIPKGEKDKGTEACEKRDATFLS